MEKNEVVKHKTEIIITLSMDDHEKWKLDIDTLLKIKLFIERS